MLKITICVGSSCSVRGSDELAAALEKLMEREQLHKTVELVGAFCMDQCSGGVSVKVGDRCFSGIRPEAAEDFFYKEVLPYVEKEGTA